MVSIESINKFIIGVICEVVVDSDIDSDTLLFEEEILDSISILYLVEELENKYDIKVPLEEVTEKNFSTIENISNFVIKQINRS